MVDARPGQAAPGASSSPTCASCSTLDDDRAVHGIRLHDLDLVPTDREADLVGHLGPDPLRDDWDPAEAVRRLSADPARAVRLAPCSTSARWPGFGNLWANELAFLTGVSPWTPIGDVDVERLVERGGDDAAALRDRRGCLPGHHRLTRPRRRPLGDRSPAAGLPALPRSDQRDGRGAGRRRQPAHVVVPRVPAGTGPGGRMGSRAQTRCSRRAASAIDPLIEG